jgi:hypothetical protein
MKEDIDSSDFYKKVSDWCSSVVSKLAVCAEDLDDHDDNDESTQFSFNEDEIEATELSFRGEATVDEVLDKLPSTVKKLSLMKKESSDVIESLNSVPHVSVRSGTELDDTDSINSDDSLLKEATSQKLSGTFTSSHTERVLHASTLSPFSKAIPSGSSVPVHKFEPLLKSMRDSHFEMHRSCLEDDISVTAAALTQHLGSNTDNSIPKAVSRLEYLVIVIVLTFTVGGILVTKYGTWF